MSDPLSPPPSLSALSSSTGSLTDSSCSSASSESSTSSASTRLSPLPEADEHDVGDVDVGSSWFNSFNEAGVGADETELMLDLRDLGFTELEGDEARMAEAGRTEDREVCGGADRVGTERFEEAEAEGFGMIEAERVGGVEAEGGEAEECQPVEGLLIRVGPSDWAVDCQVGVREREGSYGGGAEEKGRSEAEEMREKEAEGRREREEKEKRKSEAEERERFGGKSWADERDWAEALQLGDVEALNKNKGIGRLGFSEAENCLAIVRSPQVGEKTGGEAESRRSREMRGLEAEERQTRGRSMDEAERLRARTRAVNLVEFLGLGSSSDSEEGGLCVSNFGAKEPLALMAVESQPAVGYESGCGVESEGLTEEMGVMRGEMLDPGTLDDEWRQKTLVLNGEEIANSIYHMPTGYHLHLPPEGSFIHDPPEGHVGVYLKHLEFGLRFPLADEMVQIIGRMGLSLGQLTPQSVRVIVAFVWVCRFFRVPPTVDLFRSLHHIAPVSGAGYWMVVSEPGKLVVWPKKSSTKDWRGRFFFLSYPEGEWPLLRTPGLRPRRRLETDEELLSSRPLAAKKVELQLKKERRAYKHFDFKGGLPSRWLPPAEVIFNDRYLHSLGLIPALPGGKLGPVRPFIFLFFILRLLLYIVV